MKHFLLCLIFISPFYSYSQQIATLPNGKRIQIFDNGTWKPMNDSVPDSIKSSGPAIFDSSCGALILEHTDKMTGRRMTMGKSSIAVSADNDKGFIIRLMLTDKNCIILVIKAIGASPCIDEGSKILILFKDGSRQEVLSNNKYNCDGEATVYFGDIFGKLKELRQLMTKKIESMRVWTVNSFVQEDFTEDNANTFYYTLRCLYSNK